MACLALAPIRLHASAGTEGASFLDIPVGAGPAALGSAYTALATNAYAPVYNPGGLGFLKGPELAGQHLAYIQSIRYEHFSFVTPVGHDSSVHRGLGISIQDLGTGDIPRTDVQNGVPVTGLGSFSSHWGAYNLSYGQTVTEKAALGITGKMVHATIDGVSANAYAFDAGSLYAWNENLSLAAAVTNVGSKLTFLNAGDSLPMAVHAGAAYRLNPRWMITTEGVYPKTGMGSFHLGGQWRPMDAVFLRAGYKTDTLKGLNALAGLTTGFGIQAWGQELAYAWAPYGELGSAQYLSLMMRFGAETQGRRNLIQVPAPQEPRMVRNTPQLTMATDDQRLLQLLQATEVDR
jgi:hypothetical protein